MFNKIIMTYTMTDMFSTVTHFKRSIFKISAIIIHFHFGLAIRYACREIRLKEKFSKTGYLELCYSYCKTQLAVTDAKTLLVFTFANHIA